MTVDELRKSLNMGPNELLTNAKGVVADILGIDDGYVILGIVGTGRVTRLPIDMILPEAPKK